MRHPIQRQLLWPMLAVVMLGSAATAALSAWIGMRAVRQAEHERLKQLAATLTDAGFPLTDAVLKRMSELSGARFVTLDNSGTMRHVSDPLMKSDGDLLAELPVQSTFPAAGSERLFELSAGMFRAVRIPIRTAVPPGSLSLVILTPEERWDELAWQAALPPILAGILAASIAAALTVLLSQRFVARIRSLAERAALLAEGRFESQPLPAVDDELRDLAAAFNTTAEKLDRYETQIRQGERLRTLGRLGAGMAHQLRNAITGARMALDLHTAELPKEIDPESLAVAGRQLALMESYLQRFLLLGRGESPAMQEVDVSALVAEALQLVEPMCRHHGINVDWRPPANAVTLRGDSESLRQMMLNLLMNAIEAVQPLAVGERKIGVELEEVASNGGESRNSPLSLALSPGAGARGQGKNRSVVIRFWDQGPGLSEAISGRLFEPFVTDKPDGTGLGLAVARDIAEAHHGGIRWSRDAGRTWFEVTVSDGAANSQASGEG